GDEGEDAGRGERHDPGREGERGSPPRGEPRLDVVGEQSAPRSKRGRRSGSPLDSREPGSPIQVAARTRTFHSGTACERLHKPAGEGSPRTKQGVKQVSIIAAFRPSMDVSA